MDTKITVTQASQKLNISPHSIKRWIQHHQHIRNTDSEHHPNTNSEHQQVNNAPHDHTISAHQKSEEEFLSPLFLLPPASVSIACPLSNL
jgi:transposase-like protein